MKHKTRVAALMLSLSLCIGAFAVPVSALSDEDGSIVEETVETEEINEEPRRNLKQNRNWRKHPPKNLHRNPRWNQSRNLLPPRKRFRRNLRTMA